MESITKKSTLRLFEGLDGGVGITANTKILGHLTANSKTFAVTVKINNRSLYLKIRLSRRESLQSKS